MYTLWQEKPEGFKPLLHYFPNVALVIKPNTNKMKMQRYIYLYQLYCTFIFKM